MNINLWNFKICFNSDIDILQCLLKNIRKYQWCDFNDDVEPEQIKLQQSLILKLKSGISTIKNLIGHSDVIGKSFKHACPGEELYQYVPAIRLLSGLGSEVVND